MQVTSGTVAAAIDSYLASGFMQPDNILGIAGSIVVEIKTVQTVAVTIDIVGRRVSACSGGPIQVWLLDRSCRPLLSRHPAQEVNSHVRVVGVGCQRRSCRPRGWYNRGIHKLRLSTVACDIVIVCSGVGTPEQDGDGLIRRNEELEVEQGIASGGWALHIEGVSVGADRQVGGSITIGCSRSRSAVLRIVGSCTAIHVIVGRSVVVAGHGIVFATKNQAVCTISREVCEVAIGVVNVASDCCLG